MSKTSNKFYLFKIKLTKPAIIIFIYMYSIVFFCFSSDSNEQFYR